jgi:hypothetical protein
MPAWNRFVVPFLLEQFVPSSHLGIVRIFDFVPSADGVIREIWRGRMFRNNTLEVHFAHLIKECDTRSAHVIGVVQP